MKLCPICQRCYDDTDASCIEEAHGALVPSRPGSRLIADKYRLDRRLGRGGMGAVYAGTHVELDRPVALKLLLPDFVADQQALERFRREARAAARLNHPNVAATYDYGSLPGGEAYIVMELVDGQTLREYMDAAGPLPFTEALSIARQVAEGIEAAHRSGIIHRDLKPANIILALDHRGFLQAKVVDFGIAKIKEQTTSSAALTRTGSLIGTPRYMSPEQCAGQDMDARSDLYSLGVILYEMIAGRAPFDAPTATAIALKHVREQPPSIQGLRPDVPDDLAQLIIQSLAKEPAARPQAAGEFALRLHAVAVSMDIADAVAMPRIRASRTTDPQTSTADKGAATNPIPPASTSPTPSPTSLPNALEGARGTDRAGAPTVEHITGQAANQDQPENIVVATGPETVTQVAAVKPLPPKAATPLQPPPADTNAAFHPASEMDTPPSSRQFPSWLMYAGLAAALVLGIGTLWALMRHTPARRTELSSSATPLPPSTPRPVPSSTPVALTQSRTATPTPTVQTQTPKPSPSPTPTNSHPSPTPTERLTTEMMEAERTALHSALDGWLAATNSRSVESMMAYYPPTVPSFYRMRGVPRAVVRAEKNRLFAQASSVTVQRVGEPEITLSDDGLTALMRFRKQYMIEGPENRRGEVVQQLGWRKTDQGWKIIGERDLRVLR